MRESQHTASIIEKLFFHPIARVYIFIYLFGVLHRFQRCTGHITTGSWKGRGNQYIQFVRVLYCKLTTNGKQLPAFPLAGNRTPASEVGGKSVTTLPLWPPYVDIDVSVLRILLKNMRDLHVQGVFSQ